jgi:hypothetical protein
VGVNLGLTVIGFGGELALMKVEVSGEETSEIIVLV